MLAVIISRLGSPIFKDIYIHIPIQKVTGCRGVPTSVYRKISINPGPI